MSKPHHGVPPSKAWTFIEQSESINETVATNAFSGTPVGARSRSTPSPATSGQAMRRLQGVDVLGLEPLGARSSKE